MIIYKLTSPSGKSYIGLTTTTIEQRFKQHMQAAHNPNANDQRKLHNALRKYSSPDQWDKQVIFETDDYQQLLAKEIELINEHRTISEGYNTHVGGLGGSFGIANTEKHNEAISEGRKKFFQTPEGIAWKQQLRENALGNEHGKCRINTEHNEQTKMKIGNGNRGKKRTAEQKAAMSELRKQQWRDGVFSNRPAPSSETIAKRAAANRGRKQTDHQKQTVAAMRSKKWIVTFPDGHQETIVNLLAFCREHGLQDGNLLSTQPGGRSRKHKGYSVVKAEQQLNTPQPIVEAPVIAAH